MASESSSPPNPSDGNPQNPVTTAPEAVQLVTNTGATKETSVFVNTEPIREEQVQNAVKFLSHPKVKGSPVMYRRSFLERKGLTKEEIDEAFRRVPDQSPTVSNTQPAVANQGGQVQPTSNVQQAPTQYVQPTAAAPAAASSRLGTLTASRFHWSHALLAIGVLAVSGAGTAVIFKNSIVPRLKSWIRKVVLEDEEEGVSKKTNPKPSPAEEAAAAAKAAAAAASDVARASQEMLISKTEEKRYFGELMSLLNVQVQEMKLMSNSIKKLEGQSKISGRDDYRVPVTSSRPSYANGKADYDSHSARSLSPPPPAPVEPSTAPPHPKSYMEIMAMVQRGERPPNIREINDLPPNPDQPVSNPRLAPRPKPWEAAQSHISSTYHQESSNGLNSHVQDNGSGTVHQSNGDGSMPWWQQKNVRITEVEPNDENKTGFSGMASERPIQRSSWVPPQPPPVAMAEAAAAIRQPKKLPIQKEHSLTDEQFLARSAEVVTDELQKATKISESGGVLDDGGSSNMMITSEIRREEDNYVEA